MISLARIKIVLAVATALMVLTSCKKDGDPTGSDRDDPVDTLGPVIHPLLISKNPGVFLDQSGASSILNDGTSLISQCNASFRQSGQIRNVAIIPSVINSEADFAQACAAGVLAESDSDVAVLGVPRKLQFVNAIRWCGTPGTSIIGCANTPGECMVVRRFTPNQEGILLAHEFGHTKGLPHNDASTNFVMYPSIGIDRTSFTKSECAYIRRLGHLAIESTYSRDDILLDKESIEDFVKGSYPAGIPYSTARLYSESELQAVLPWLTNDVYINYWSNIVSVVGIVASPGAYTQLETFVMSEASGKLRYLDYEARVAAIMSMGYILKARPDQDALTFLQNFSDPDAWAIVDWLAPFHNSPAEKNEDLAAAAKLGLAIRNS